MSIKIFFHDQIYENYVTVFKTKLPPWKLIQKSFELTCLSQRQFQSVKLENGPRSCFKYHRYCASKLQRIHSIQQSLSRKFLCLSLKKEMLLQNSKKLHRKILSNFLKLQNEPIKNRFMNKFMTNNELFLNFMYHHEI